MGTASFSELQVACRISCRHEAGSPVTFPPGRARLDQRARHPTGSSLPSAITMGIVRGASCASHRRRLAYCPTTMTSTLEPNQLGRQGRRRSGCPSAVVGLDRDVLARRRQPSSRMPSAESLPACLCAGLVLSRPPRDDQAEHTFSLPCCASAASGAARSTAPVPARNVRRSITGSPHPPAPAATAGSSGRGPWRS